MSNQPERLTAPPDVSRIDAENEAIAWPALEAIIHVDPAGRGLASYRRSGVALDAGQLQAAALDLAKNARSVAIVTGFFVEGEDGAAAETDGPPGALFLARALSDLGVDVCLMTDTYGLPMLITGKVLWKMHDVEIVDVPLELGPATAPSVGDDDGDCEMIDRWFHNFLESPRGQSLTHVVAVERCGPSHTRTSVTSQVGTSPATLDLFSELVPVEHRNRCHNMRGESIDKQTAKMHRLFDAIAARKQPIRTIGIGDGGNEIGMGSFRWSELVVALDSPPAPWIVCRTPTDHTIVSGISNWGAYALALAVGRLCGAVDRGGQWSAEGQRSLIELMIEMTSAVDGLTRRNEPTVDGLPLNDYLRPLDELRRLLGYADAPPD